MYKVSCFTLKEGEKMKVIEIGAESYPKKLLNIYDIPKKLYVIGLINS